MIAYIFLAFALVFHASDAASSHRLAQVTKDTKFVADASTSKYMAEIQAKFKDNGALNEYLPEKRSSLRPAANQQFIRQKLSKLNGVTVDEKSLGWLYMYSYQGGSHCGGEEEFYYMYGVVTNMCLTGKSSNSTDNSTETSYTFTCSGGYAQYMTFSGSNCEELVSSVPRELTCTRNHTDPSYYAEEETAFTAQSRSLTSMNEEVDARMNVTDDYVFPNNVTDDFIWPNVTDDFVTPNITDDYIFPNATDDYFFPNVTDDDYPLNVTDDDYHPHNITDDDYTPHNITDDDYYHPHNITDDDYTPHNITDDDYHYNVTDDDNFNSTDDDSNFPLYNVELICQPYDASLELEGDFYLNEYYETSDCYSPIYFEGSKNDQCYETSGSVTVYIDAPYYYVYDGEDCTGTIIEYGSLPTENVCEATTYYDDLFTAEEQYNHDFATPYNQFKLTSEVDATRTSFSPSLAPTKMPSVAPNEATLVPSLEPSHKPTTTIKPSYTPTKVPTRSPTGVLTIAPTSKVQVSVSYNVTQGYSGITEDDYEEDLVQNNYIIGDTVSSFLTGVNVDDVKILSISSPETLAVDLLDDVSLIIMYEVTCSDVYSAGYTSAQEAYDDMKSDLDTAIAYGDFTTKMRQDAEDLSSSDSSVNIATGATLRFYRMNKAAVILAESALSNATGLAATYSNFTSTTVEHTDTDDNGGGSDDDNKLSDGAIAGIVIGTVVGAGLLVGGAYYVVSTQQASGGLSAQQGGTQGGGANSYNSSAPAAATAVRTEERVDYKSNPIKIKEEQQRAKGSGKSSLSQSPPKPKADIEQGDAHNPFFGDKHL